MNIRKIITPSLFVVAIYLSHSGAIHGQVGSLGVDVSTTLVASVCAEATANSNVKEAMRLVCLRERIRPQNVNTRMGSAIVIGFVGGFVKYDDVKHPEVQFAAFLRRTYPSIVRAEVFANHDGRKALRRVLQLLDDDEDGVLTDAEKGQAKIIVYGHSWGASETVTLARELGRLGVPVLLTIQVDSVHKLGHDDSKISPNVRKAVNFYQTGGLIHGRSSIRAADPKRTDILGNFRISYRGRRINCDNYSWIARHLNKPHHEIENDPEVWDQISSLIDSELLQASSATTSLPAETMP